MSRWSVPVVVLCGAVVLAAAVPGATASAARGGAVLPLVHGGRHPGAAVLAGDVVAPRSVRYLPRPSAAYDDKPGDHGCFVPANAEHVRFCGFGVHTRPRVTVALVGDSMAGQWLPALHRLALARHWKVITALRSSCPFTPVMIVRRGDPRPYEACHTDTATVLSAMLHRYHPRAVITSDRTSGTVRHPDPGRAATEEIAGGMAAYWRTLVAAHITVIGIRETPEMGRTVPPCLERATAEHCSATRAHAVEATVPVVVAHRLAPRGTRVIDMNDLICAARTCRPVVGNVLVYRDSHHLTRTYSATLAPYLERRLLRIPGLAGR